MDASRKRGRSDAAPNGNGKGTADSKRMKEKESFQTGIGSKSKPCTKFFSMAGCPFGEGCHFLHYFPGGVKAVAQMSNHPVVVASSEGPPAAAIKTRICTNYGTAEGCKYGDKCRFAHGERELQRPIIPHQAAAATLLAAAAAPGPASSFGASATAKISVDASLVSAIIGKGGMNTKQICRLTGAKLAIRDHDSDPKLRNVELEGSFDQIKQASTMVRELAAQFGSSPAAAAPPPAAAAPPTKAPPGGNLKTKLCDNFAKGSCTFGDRCHFAHGAGELRKSAAA